MSATLGMLLSRLDPSLKIMMVERLGKVANESTHSLNNAGTGHAGYCELNYTPEKADGSKKSTKHWRLTPALRYRCNSGPGWLSNTCCLHRTNSSIPSRTKALCGATRMSRFCAIVLNCCTNITCLRKWNTAKTTRLSANGCRS